MQKLSQQKKTHKRLTIEELRAYKGFENLSDKEAEETIDSLEKLSILMFEFFKKSNRCLKHMRKIE